MRYIVIIAALLLLIPLTASAGDCCGKCKSKCSPCKTACSTCESPCAPKCSPCKTACSPCKTGCEPKCHTCKQASCTKPCGDCGKCGAPSCRTGCPAPCACSEWEPYCGCGTLTGLCISLEASCADGTAAPVYLILRDNHMRELAMIELAPPIEGYYQMTYTFDTPLDATAPTEALLLNENDDTVTLEWLRVTGLMDCRSHTYFDHTCPGVVIGPGGCPRMVLF